MPLKKNRDKQSQIDDYDIYSFLGKEFRCSYCNKKHYIPTKIVESKKDAITVFPSLIERVGRGKNILLLADDITYAVAGEKIERVFKSANWQIEKLIIRPQGTKKVHAEEKYLPPIFSAVKEKDILLTVGSGSITDMGKYAGDILGIPVVCFPTAPSMNAYTSGVAALIKNSIKVTLPVTPPEAVIIDTDIILNSPIDLIQAGFADSMAKCFANADWRISSIITGEHFCPLPTKIVTAGEKKYLTRGRELLNRNEEVISALMDGLLIAGFSMVIAGTSSPASGGEHLLSHYLDMHAHKRAKEPFAYHGLQVGIGVVVAAKIYEMLQDFSIEDVRKRLARREETDHRKGEHWKDFEKKVPILKALPASLIQNWDEIGQEIFPTVYSQETVEKCLTEAGCPTHFSEIGIGRELACQTIMNARYIRDRVTVLDVADELGILRDVADEILQEFR